MFKFEILPSGLRIACDEAKGKAVADYSFWSRLFTDAREQGYEVQIDPSLVGAHDGAFLIGERRGDHLGEVYKNSGSEAAFYEALSDSGEVTVPGAGHAALGTKLPKYNF